MKRRTLIGGSILGATLHGSAGAQSAHAPQNEVTELQRQVRDVDARTFADFLSARADTADRAIGRMLGTLAGAYQVVETGGDVVTTGGVHLKDLDLAPVAITVGRRGDFATLNEALWAAQKMRRSYRSRGIAVEVRQLADFVLEEQVFVVQDDLSFITLTSEAPEVRINRASLNKGNGRAATNNWRTGVLPAFCAMRGGALPYIRTLYAMDDSGDGSGTVGVYVFENGRAVVARGCGVKNAGWRGAYVDAGFFYARQSVWSGSGYAGGPEGAAGGVRGSNQAVLMIREVDATHCTNGAYLSDCIANVSDADFSNASNIGLGVHAGANVYGGGVKADDCGLRGLHVTLGGRLVSGESSNALGAYPSARNCGQNAAHVDDGGELVLEKAALSSRNGHAVEVINATARLNAATITAAKGRGINAAENSQVGAVSAHISSAEDWAVRLFNGSSFNACNARIQGHGGDVHLDGGSQANLANARRSDGESEIISNVWGGEYSPMGKVTGLDQRIQFRDETSSFALFPESRPHHIVRGDLADPIQVALFTSTQSPHKRFEISHIGTGADVLIYEDSHHSKLIATLSPRQTCRLTPDGRGGWFT
ncbi:hypothetical protein [Brevundimonas sp.]|jgi:hypothetical protein|uniref:hypothetical protein n=1 Tax=Brevundimonas sp. TaxID=1871086 RepID=UPI0037C164B7